ncbi:MAG: hypothetical protein JWP29_2193 [Rhodoferax sp.]|nr:hypothetical protein [Rhodoferax sp.]
MDTTFETTLETLYTVALRDYPELPLKERLAAEVRYCRALERRLGPPVDVAHALRAVEQLSDGGDITEVSEEERKLVAHWRVATDAARQAAMQGLGESPEAWFDVRVA